MMNVMVLSLSYIIEDGEWSVGIESGGEFKWWNYLVGEDRKLLGCGYNGVDVKEVVLKWVEDVKEDVCEDFGNYGREESVSKFLEVVDGLDLDEYMFNIVEWGVEYDTNISIVLSK